MPKERSPKQHPLIQGKGSLGDQTGIRRSLCQVPPCYPDHDFHQAPLKTSPSERLDQIILIRESSNIAPRTGLATLKVAVSGHTVASDHKRSPVPNA